ncbi:MAG: HAMP domain-containing sensor histidine kinase [Candidatus Gracilibacteria bacterium]|nr:HAMP domain-containing sensor histidine kinase [Candidatus Gracilibacteria bacterium]
MFYILNPLLHIIGISLLFYFATQQLKKQAYLNKIRLKRILLGAFLPLSAAIILQLILPAFGIWILEKEIIFFYLVFVIYVVYVLKRYYFSSLGYGIGKIIIAIAAFTISILSINIFKIIYLRIGNTSTINNYWIYQDQFSILDTAIGVFVFYFSYKLLCKILIGNTLVMELNVRIQKLEKYLSQTTNVKDLNDYLGSDIRKIFKNKYCEVRVFSKDEEKTELQKYFENSLTDKIFINDVVFIEEKKNKFQKKKLLLEIPDEAFLILPLFDSDSTTNIGVFIMGAKSFGDFYTTEEINILRDFASFLELHLKYIKTYGLMRDLSANLDEKVDEKTMEYNNLINKQKEFIIIISHEIKAPISNAIFQADSIMDDLKNEPFSRKTIEQDLIILNEQLIKTGELTTKLFALQYFDTRTVTLFKERVKIEQLLQTEYEVYSRMHEEIKFINLIDKNIGFISIDKIQFRQVITNLLQNAIKFLDKKDSIIIVEAYKKKNTLTIIIEDNGRGFQGIDVEHLFDRYTTGNGNLIGLGMGLYLCKKIVDMHEGTILASIGERLGGAKFSITIPIN